MRSWRIHRASARSSARHGALVTGAVVAGAVVTAAAAAGIVAAGGAAAGTTPQVTARVEPTPLSSTEVLRFGFEPDATGAIADESGRGHELRRETTGGGTIRMVPHDAGWAVAFPPRCSGTRCPRAVLQVPHRADLNPGAALFDFGATVKLAPNQTTKGQNVVQKGYSATGSQYKLQIDGTAGKPSCVLVDRREPTVRLAKSDRTVADGMWHTIACRRSHTALTIVVDGTVRGRTRVPTGLSIDNALPLNIGGKGAYQNNDQFQGALDDVWINVDRDQT